MKFSLYLAFGSNLKLWLNLDPAALISSYGLPLLSQACMFPENGYNLHEWVAEPLEAKLLGGFHWHPQLQHLLHSQDNDHAQRSWALAISLPFYILQKWDYWQNHCFQQLHQIQKEFVLNQCPISCLPAIPSSKDSPQLLNAAWTTLSAVASTFSIHSMSCGFSASDSRQSWWACLEVSLTPYSAWDCR